MGEALKELGKLFNNLALLIAGALIVQPMVKHYLSAKLLLKGIIGFILFTSIGFVLISIGENLKGDSR